MAQEGFEPSASLILRESGLPVAYRATMQFRGLESNQRPPRSKRGVTRVQGNGGAIDHTLRFQPPELAFGSVGNRQTTLAQNERC